MLNLNTLISRYYPGIQVNHEGYALSDKGCRLSEVEFNAQIIKQVEKHINRELVLGIADNTATGLSAFPIMIGSFVS